jgi:hypothetical protein
VAYISFVPPKPSTKFLIYITHTLRNNSLRGRLKSVYMFRQSSGKKKRGRTQEGDLQNLEEERKAFREGNLGV